MRTTLEHTSMLDSPKVNKCTEVNTDNSLPVSPSHLGAGDQAKKSIYRPHICVILRTVIKV